jgi:SAM-dependent methyltransferase
MSLRLREVTNDDLPLIEQWLHADHVRTTWGDPGANLRLLNEPPADGNWRAMIEADGHKVGIVLWQHPTREELAARALGLCRELRESPAVLDLGCGVGGQTLQLAELTSGSIVAIDSHAPSIERLKAAVEERGFSQRVNAIVGNMARPGQPLGVFDLIWSEGALYNIGLRDALRVCHGLLRPGGYLAFTDAIWRRKNPPPAVKAGFDVDYPTMGWLDDDIAAIQDCGCELVGHFTLPDEVIMKVGCPPKTV